MVAEFARELPFTPEDGESSRGQRLEIAPGSHQKTELFYGTARVSRHHTANYTLELPLDYVSSEVIDVNVNGLAAAKPSYRRVREASAQLGKPSVSLAARQNLPAIDLLAPRGIFDTERYRQEAVSATLDDIQKHFGDDILFRLKGHSTGGRTSVAVAEDSPERIESVTLVNSAGLVEGQTIKDYIARLKGFYDHEVVPNWDTLRHDFSHPKVLADFVWYNFGNTLRTGVEAVSISNADIRSRVVQLGDLGVKVAIMDALADRLTPNTSVASTLGMLVDHYSMHPHPEVGHLGPQVHALEVAMEYHAIDRMLHPEEVIPPRLFAVRAVKRLRKNHDTPYPVTVPAAS